MHREHREFKKMQIEFRTWLTGDGGITAQQTEPFGKDRTCVVVSSERVFDAFMRDHPGADGDFVMAQVRTAQGSYSGVRVFEDSALANCCRGAHRGDE